MPSLGPQSSTRSISHNPFTKGICQFACESFFPKTRPAQVSRWVPGTPWSTTKEATTPYLPSFGYPREAFMFFFPAQQKALFFQVLSCRQSHSWKPRMTTTCSNQQATQRPRHRAAPIPGRARGQLCFTWAEREESSPEQGS